MHPDIYFEALKKLSVKENECIAIEDSVDSVHYQHIFNQKIKLKCKDRMYRIFPGLFHMDDDFSFCKKMFE